MPITVQDEDAETILSPEARALAVRLSMLTGESVPAVVTHALQDALETRKSETVINDEAQRMLEAGREIRSHIRGTPSSDLSDLYDQDGLPR